MKKNPENVNDLNRYRWMLQKHMDLEFSEEDLFQPSYGDVTALNTCRVILDAVGKDNLRRIGEDAVDLLGTSVAVYEKNGDYAFGMFSSGWCRLMDQRSFALCKTKDLTEALACGEWHCHESCRHDSAAPAIGTGRRTDIACAGGIHMFAEPIRAFGEVIGVINIGYGDPPSNPEKIAALSDLYHVSKEQLAQTAGSYESRPVFLIDLAKKRLIKSAKMIGQIVELHQTQALVKARGLQYRNLYHRTPALLHSLGQNGRLVRVSDYWCQVMGYAREEVIGKKLVDFMTAPSRRLAEETAIPAFFREGFLKDVPYHFVKKSGEVMDVLLSAVMEKDEKGNFSHSLAISNDITELNRMKEAIHSREKMEALGQLAGGVAHDFNTLLGIIMGYADMLQEGISDQRQVKENIGEIMDAAYRVK